MFERANRGKIFATKTQKGGLEIFKASKLSPLLPSSPVLMFFFCFFLWHLGGVVFSSLFCRGKTPSLRKNTNAKT